MLADLGDAIGFGDFVPIEQDGRRAAQRRAFKRDEVFKYDVVLEPEQCAEPDYRETVVPPSGGRWGYTRHECAVCGYHWLDSYTPPES